MDSGKIKSLATGVREDLCGEVKARLADVLRADSAQRLSDPEGIRRLEASIAEQGRRKGETAI